jgi:hypothetical protein
MWRRLFVFEVHDKIVSSYKTKFGRGETSCSFRYTVYRDEFINILFYRSVEGMR